MTMRPVKHAIDSNCYLAETPNLSAFYTAHDVDVRVSLVKDGHNAHNVPNERRSRSLAEFWEFVERRTAEEYPRG